MIEPPALAPPSIPDRSARKATHRLTTMDPLPCDLCSKKASVYFTQIIGGKMQKVNLCESCAKEKGVTDPTGFALADLLFGMGQKESSGRRPRGQEECPGCGLTADQLKKTGRVGCPQCYHTFSDGLQSILRAMHKGLRHNGKIPYRMAERRARSEFLAALRRDLEAAVAEERFEDAAKLRDAIQTVESSPAAIPSAPSQSPTRS